MSTKKTDLSFGANSIAPTTVNPKRTSTVESLPDDSSSRDAAPDHKIGDKYVLVSVDSLKKGMSSDVMKSDDKSKDSKDVRPLLGLEKLSLTGGTRRRLNNLRTRICLPKAAVSSGAGGTLAYVIDVQPSLSGEWSSFAALYDEVKVHGGKFHYMIGQTAGAGSFSTPPWHAVAFDPSSLASYTSVAVVVPASQRRMECGSTGYGSVVGGTLSGLGLLPDGFRTLEFRVPKGTQAAIASIAGGNGNISGQWGSMTDTGDNWGYVKGFSEALGGTAVVTIEYFLELFVEFRSRS